MNKDTAYPIPVFYILQVVDAQLPTGNIPLVIAMETNEGIIIVGKIYHFKRSKEDRSILKLNITNDIKQQKILDGRSMQFNLSLAHLLTKPDGSHSNAYDIEIFVYYDSSFIEFQSMKFIEKDRFSLAPSTNTTKQGLIHLHTNALWLINNQHVTIDFKMKNPQAIRKGEDCKGYFLVDFRYMTNLPKFNGTVNYTVNKKVEYRCEIDQLKDISLKSYRLALPQLSMLYDEVNGEFVFCLQKVIYATRNGPFCYRQGNESSEWHGINEIVAVVGINTATRVLYGIDRKGKVYLRSSYPFQVFNQIENAQWTTDESKPGMRKSVKVNDVSSLPASPTEQASISVSGLQLWAATKSNIMKKVGWSWKKIVKL